MNGSLEYFGATIKRLWTPQDDARMFIFAAEIPAGFPELRLEGQTWSCADRNRLSALSHPRRRAQFCAGRILLKHAANEVFANSAEPWRIVTLVSGGVQLVSEGSSAHASIAHSGNRVVCAIAPSGRIGVDIELLRLRKTGWRQLAAAALHPGEIERLRGSEDDAGWDAFYRLWVMKEAVAKALGVGLGLGFGRLLIAPDFSSVSTDAGPDSLLHLLRLVPLDCGAGAVGAVAWCPDHADIGAWLQRSSPQ